MPWQFTIDNRPAGPVRAVKAQAMRDAVNDGYATWVGRDEVRLDESNGAAIVYIDPRDYAKQVKP